MDQNDRLVILVLVVGILLGILFGAFAATAAGSVIALLPSALLLSVLCLVPQRP